MVNLVSFGLLYNNTELPQIETEGTTQASNLSNVTYQKSLKILVVSAFLNVYLKDVS